MNKKAEDPGFASRLERAIGPIIAGMILDMADFATFRHIGIYFGLLVGGFVGWYLTGFLGMSRQWRIYATCMAALYCAVPGTEFLPFATILGAVSRFFEPPSSRKDVMTCDEQTK
jgi:hypothetical protein